MLSSDFFFLVQVRMLSIFESGPVSGFYQASAGTDFIHFEFGSAFDRVSTDLCPGPRQDFTNTPQIAITLK